MRDNQQGGGPTLQVILQPKDGLHVQHVCGFYKHSYLFNDRNKSEEYRGTKDAGACAVPSYVI